MTGQVDEAMMQSTDKTKADIQDVWYGFGPFSFRSKPMELYHQGKLTALNLQPARLLKILLEASPDLVSREELQRKLWNTGTVVEFEQGLNACVSQLRKALNDTVKNPKYLATRPKRGYQIICEVQARSNQVARKTKSGLLLVFASFILVTALWGQSVLSNRNALADAPLIYVAPVQMAESGVVHQDAMVQFKLRLGVVRNLHRQNVQSVKTLSGTSLWQDPVLRSPTNPDETGQPDFTLFLALGSHPQSMILEAQLIDRDKVEFLKRKFPLAKLDAAALDALAGQVTAWVTSSVSGKAFENSPDKNPSFQTASAEYFEAMMQARQFFQLSDAQNLRQAEQWFSKASEENPQSTTARGGRAISLAVLAGSQGYPAKATYRRAMHLADTIRADFGPSALSELVRGYVYMYRDWDLIRARQALQLAAALAPGDALVHSWTAALLAAEGDANSAADEVILAAQLDPLSTAIAGDRCWYMAASGRLEEAVQACRQSMDQVPGKLSAVLSLSAVLAQQGKFEEATKTMQRVIKAIGVSSADNDFPHMVNSASVPDEEKLRRQYCQLADFISNKVETYQIPYSLYGSVLAKCGAFPEAAIALETAWQSGESGMLFYAIDLQMESFRRDSVSQSIDLSIRTRPDDFAG